eukprot:gene17390-19132_t
MEERNTDNVQCTQKCVEQPKCRSYNLNIDEKICQLNSKALIDNNTSLIQQPGWVYRSTDYNYTLVGVVCETLNPCQPGILCRETCDSPFYECVTCDKYHYGLHCDKRRDLDECACNPCKNGANCTDLVADYSCNCAAGYTGKSCEIDINECNSFPCKNEAACIDQSNSYKCNCKRGFTGTHCETDINECSSAPCASKMICQDLLNSYKCICKNSGYYGPKCLCGGTFTMAGSIVSPYYPSNYINSLNCAYDVTAPAGKFIKITFIKFKIEKYYTNIGRGDRLEIKETVNGGMKIYHGASLPPVHCTSRSNSLKLKFITDGSVAYNGFNITYKFTAGLVSKQFSYLAMLSKINTMAGSRDFQRFLILSLLLVGVDLTILRLPCGKYANFSISALGKKLQGHVIMEERNTDNVQCTQKCVEQPKCRSYNLNIDEKICQLNSKALIDNNTSLIQQPGWVYRSTDYNYTLVGVVCETLNPCQPGILCRETCDSPFYECVTCDQYHYGLHCDKKKGT